MSSKSHGALGDSVLAAWSTTNLTTIYLVERLPEAVWTAALPGSPRRTVRMLAGHLHNSRCMWLKTLAKPLGLKVPASVDRRRVTRAQLVAALKESGRGLGDLLALGLERGGSIPATPAYRWRNLPLDVGHVLAYFAAHEGHHRGQIVMAARQLRHRLPAEVTGGLWQWTRRVKEAGSKRALRTPRRRRRSRR